jgi:hypothetical protein
VYESCGWFGLFGKNEFDISSVCSTGTKFENGKCVSTVDVASDNASICSTGTKFENGKCVSTVDVASDNASICSTGTKFENGKCVFDGAHVCGPGTQVVHGVPLSTRERLVLDRAMMNCPGTCSFDDEVCLASTCRAYSQSTVDELTDDQVKFQIEGFQDCADVPGQTEDEGLKCMSDVVDASGAPNIPYSDELDMTIPDDMTIDEIRKQVVLSRAMFHCPEKCTLDEEACMMRCIDIYQPIVDNLTDEQVRYEISQVQRCLAKETPEQFDKCLSDVVSEAANLAPQT